MTARSGTIEIVAHAAPWLSWLLFARWRRMSIAIDGELGRVRWGTHVFAVAPGEHVVFVGMGGTFASKAEVTVQVAANETVRLRYTPRLNKHARGSLEVERLPAARVMQR
ncbi:MAG TPA: hypothetical protein VIV11_04510 [Kofleriaceae bacterium]